MQLVAKFPDATFWHGNSLDLGEDYAPFANRTLVVSDPPAALATRFWLAMLGADNFLIFAGLLGSARVIAEKVMACDHFVQHETDKHTCNGNPATLHTMREYGSLRPQHVITRTAIPTSITIAKDLRIHDEDCRDCLLPEFIFTAILQYIDSKSYDTIYDPFMGDGSTAIAAHLLGKKFMGMDSDLDRVKQAAEKYRSFTAK